jgi:hypothetical protein
MAQVFEIPTGKPDSNQPTVLLEPSPGFFANFPDRRSRPASTHLLGRYPEYGTAPGLPQARKRSSDVCRARRLIPGAGDPKVNQSCPV